MVTPTMSVYPTPTHLQSPGPGDAKSDFHMVLYLLMHIAILDSSKRGSLWQRVLPRNGLR
jgi:hypothetical protein